LEESRHLFNMSIFIVATLFLEILTGDLRSLELNPAVFGSSDMFN